MDEIRISEWKREAGLVAKVLASAPEIDKFAGVQLPEFQRRQSAAYQALSEAGIDAAIVYCDEHYNGDVPYLAGNTNITIEPVAGVLGKTGFHVLAGLEGGYVVEQLAARSGAKVHKVEMLKLADEDYPIAAERVEDVLEEACGRRPTTIGLFTPRSVIPVSLYQFLRDYLGGGDGIIDCQELFYRLKYEKSDTEMRLIGEASKIADTAMRGMLAVLKPGMLETQVAAWGYAIIRELGGEESGFDIIVNANEANRTLIGKALNRIIHEGDYVNLGVAPKRDGLTSCVRTTAIAVDDPAKVTPEQRFWLELVEEGYKVGLAAYERVARENRPAREQEQALVDYFRSRSAAVSKRIGRDIDLALYKPYTGTHNSGYTECQEFFGAITLNSGEPLGRQIVTMLDVALRGVGNSWDDVVIPGFDYAVIERTLGKFGAEVRVLTQLPTNPQYLVGRVD